MPFLIVCARALPRFHVKKLKPNATWTAATLKEVGCNGSHILSKQGMDFTVAVMRLLKLNKNRYQIYQTRKKLLWRYLCTLTYFVKLEVGYPACPFFNTDHGFQHERYVTTIRSSCEHFFERGGVNVSSFPFRHVTWHSCSLGKRILQSYKAFKMT